MTGRFVSIDREGKQRVYDPALQARPSVTRVGAPWFVSAPAGASIWTRLKTWPRRRAIVRAAERLEAMLLQPPEEIERNLAAIDESVRPVRVGAGYDLAEEPTGPETHDWMIPDGRGGWVELPSTIGIPDQFFGG